MKKNNLYIECYSGISGDMMVASLLDLGADEKVLLSALKSLNVDGFEIKIGRTKKCGIDACDFDVILTEEQGNGHSYHHSHGHDHSQDNHSHNHDHGHDHGHTHEHHNHDHEHTHEHHDHLHNNGDHHRNIVDIYKIIDNSCITTKAKEIAKKIFDVVALAESKAHGLAINEVHFHEVGAIDSIIDIVATAVCIDNLNIEDVYVSELYEGSGHVKCQHGIIPVPVPAVVNIVSEHSIPIRITDVKGELVTPTGAAIAAALKTKDKLSEEYTIKRIGIGAGKKDFKKANILRTYIIDEKDEYKHGVWVLETNIDDSTGESLGYTMEKLFEKGAKDVFFTPIFMKKNRPAQMLKVICEEELINDMESIIFKHTTTIGIRKYKTGRTVLKREIKDIETIYGLIRFKMCTHDGNEYYYPEYEDVKAICDKTGLSYTEVYKNIISCTI